LGVILFIDDLTANGKSSHGYYGQPNQIHDGMRSHDVQEIKLRLRCFFGDKSAIGSYLTMPG
jgi:putative heme iron utilization protein